jgi:hypothetical protein
MSVPLTVKLYQLWKSTSTPGSMVNVAPAGMMMSPSIRYGEPTASQTPETFPAAITVDDEKGAAKADGIIARLKIMIDINIALLRNIGFLL